MVTRALLEDSWAGPSPQPHQLLQPICPPVLIVGLHRTSTTLLQRLLAADPAARLLLYWESSCPFVMIDRGRADRSAAARRQAAIDMMAVVRKIVPYLDEIHETKAEGPEECFWLLMVSLVTHAYAMQWRVADYRSWLDARTEAEVVAACSDYVEWEKRLAAQQG